MSKTSFLSVACVLAMGCSEAVPPELADARQAYADAEQGPAAQVNPAGLHEAAKALTKAEATYEDEGATFKAQDRAYIAARKAKIAETQARTMQAEQQTAKVRAQTRAMEQAALQQLGSTKRDLQGQIKSQQNQLQSQQQILEQERERRQQAEKLAEQARADLARIAQVGETERGTVITLPGNLFFASGKSELLPSAQAKMSQVAQVLVTTSPDATMQVEGHTDSQGAEKYNQQLSEQRAQTVREYLVSRGVAADRITSKGLGESQPIADNKSPEGRANNRRVEIIVQPAAGSAGGGSGAQQGQGAGQGNAGKASPGAMGNPGMGVNTEGNAKGKTGSGDTTTPTSGGSSPRR